MFSRFCETNWDVGGWRPMRYLRRSPALNIRAWGGDGFGGFRRLRRLGSFVFRIHISGMARLRRLKVRTFTNGDCSAIGR